MDANASVPQLKARSCPRRGAGAIRFVPSQVGKSSPAVRKGLQGYLELLLRVLLV